MNPQRVAFVAPTFWPVISPTQIALAEIAEAIQSMGIEVAIFAQKNEPQTTSRFHFRELPVNRIERPPPRPWARGRYGRIFAREIAQMHSSWDAIFVFGAGEELVGISQAIPPLTGQLILRLDQPLFHDRSLLAGLRPVVSAIRNCQQVFGNCDQVHEWLRLADIAFKNVTVIPDGLSCISPPVNREMQRESARKTLAELHPLLSFEKGQPVAVCAAPLCGDRGMFDLLQAWRVVRRSLPRAQLVLIGDGPQAETLWGTVQSLNLQGNVVLAGAFDSWEDVFAAADVYVNPIREALACPFLLRAMAQEVPCITTSSDALANLAVHDQSAWLFQPGHVEMLAAALAKLLGDRELQQRLGQCGRRVVVSNRNIQETASRILALMEQPNLAACGIKS